MSVKQRGALKTHWGHRELKLVLVNFSSLWYSILKSYWNKKGLIFEWEEFMFQNVAYRPTVYKTGGKCFKNSNILD